MQDYGSKLTQEQQLRQQQRLNPQSVALGRVLEMSVPEFEDEVRRELDDNPALEAVEKHGEETRDDFNETSEQLQLADYDDIDDAPAYLRRAANRSADDVHVEAASFAADEGESMGEVLLRRLAGESELNETQMRIAAHIIGNLDDNGYLRRPLSSIADDLEMIEGFYATPAEVRHVLDEVRALDPAGIAAFDLRDCLMLQLDRKPASETQALAREIIDKYFDLFSRKHFDRIQSHLGVGREDMEAALALIRSLNPKPASALETGRAVGRAVVITPDFYLEYDADDDTFTLTLPGNIPELAVETTFAADSDSVADRLALEFIRRKRGEAVSFIRLVEQRRNTLMAIGTAIVKLQRNFMISGDKADIRPMILKDVQALTALDLSVISRATSGKYILTPNGIFPLKLLFNERPDADTDVSTHAILDALGKLIENEDKNHPLSDQTLSELLHEAGYDIARRTVAKYRERLGFPVARLRREY